MTPLVRKTVDWSVGWVVVGLSQFPERAGSYTSVLLSDHFFLKRSLRPVMVETAEFSPTSGRQSTSRQDDIHLPTTVVSSGIKVTKH